MDEIRVTVKFSITKQEKRGMFYPKFTFPAAVFTIEIANIQNAIKLLIPDRIRFRYLMASSYKPITLKSVAG